jgi:hypothetical protein
VATGDHIGPLIRSFGRIEVQRDTVRVVAWHTGAWEFERGAPFNELQPGKASSPGYRRAFECQHAAPHLPCGLDVRLVGTKVLSNLWAGRQGMLDRVRPKYCLVDPSLLRSNLSSCEQPTR